jgi:hypothetical protein
MPPAISSSSQIRQIFQLRAIVATLGERTTPPWWRTQFLTNVGVRALTRVFPRTALSAALNSVLVVARAEHDKRIGLGKSYHLFRLSENIEHSLMLLMSEQALSTQVAALASKSQEDLIQDLANMAAGREEPLADGPIRLGSNSSITESSGIEGLAVHYRNSFETGRRAFPYFGDWGHRS